MRSHHPKPRSTLSGSATSPFSSPFSDLDDEQLKTVLSLLKQELDRRHDTSSPRTDAVPIEIFAGDLAPAEALVKYLKENLSLRFTDMAKILNRDERGLWTSYHRALKKKKGPFVIPTSECMIPLSVFSLRERSHLENLVTFLVDERRYPLKEISKLIHKAYSTIYTAYRRAKLKGGVSR